jgi:acyl-CoA thioester hydrolase
MSAIHPGGKPGPFRVWEDIPVRFRDTDAMGHVNNAVYLSYLEVGRQAYWQRFSNPQSYDRVPFVLAHVRIDFRAEALVGEVVRVYLRTTWVSRSSFGMQYALHERDAGRILVEAESVQVTYDYTRKASIAVPEWLRKELEGVEGRSLPPRPDAD